MFGIGANELILILIFGFIIFGPDKMPAMAKTLGQAIKKFRTAQDEMSNVIKNEVYNPDSDDPFKNPLDALSKLEKTAQLEDKGESFSDRKARYDRQREAKKAAEERRAAKSAAQGDDQDSSGSSSKSRTPIKKTSTSGTGGSSTKPALTGATAGLAARAQAANDTRAAKAAEKAADAAEEKPEAKNSADASMGDDKAKDDTAQGAKKPTPDELFGTKPKTKEKSKVKAPHAKPAPAPVKAASTTSEPVDKKAAEAADDLFEEGEE